MINKKVYFHNLNALRFIAAMMVIVQHIEIIKSNFNLPNHATMPAIIMGHVAVVLFFVLSGFLITYLLLTEDALHQKINIRQFYLRRILRIWPLYFLICILGLFVIPHLAIFNDPTYTPAMIDAYGHHTLMVVLYMLFLPNLAYALFTYVPYIAYCWSIGTEEQFYLVWPWLTKFFRHGKKVYVFFLVIMIHLLIRMSNELVPPNPLIDKLYQFWAFFSIQCMAIGGFFAYVIFKDLRSYIKVFFHPIVFGVAAIGSIVCIATGFEVPHFDKEFYSVLFGIVIVNLACNKKIGGILENKVTNYLGKISYGLYMYHTFIILLIINLLPTPYKGNSLILYPLVIGGSILIASLSYFLMEEKFIKIKERFATITSGDKAREN